MAHMRRVLTPLGHQVTQQWVFLKHGQLRFRSTRETLENLTVT